MTEVQAIEDLTNTTYVFDTLEDELKDYMQVEPVLDELQKEGLLSSGTIQKIKNKCTNKGKMLLELKRYVKGGDTYHMLKKCLRSSGQSTLAELFEAAEKNRDLEDIKKRLFDDPERPPDAILREHLITYYREHASIMSVEKHAIGPTSGQPKQYQDSAKSSEQLTEKQENEQSGKQSLIKEKQVFILANAGVDETSIAETFAVLWYHAHTPDSNVVEDSSAGNKSKLADFDNVLLFDSNDLILMKKYDFLFLIKLREHQNTCDLDEMILEMINANLRRKSSYSKDFIEEILRKKRCLIVLDGLDEWRPPSTCEKLHYLQIPHIKSWGFCSVLTATQPLKLSTAANIERHVKVCLLDEAFRWKLENIARRISGFLEWEICIELLAKGKNSKAEEMATRLMSEENSPNQAQLNRLQEMRKTTHLIVAEVSKRICSEIKSRSTTILNVWPAYKSGYRDQVVFVVETNAADLKIDVSYKYEPFSADYFNENQNSVTKESKTDKELPESETATLVQFIQKNAAELFKKHRHLSYIKPSILREEDRNKDKLAVSKNTCIAFYVQRKDYIPLDEEPFEAYYENFTAVVREGVFILQTGIKMGCEITSVRDNTTHYPFQGRLGGFVEHPYYGLCGLTCAHIFLNSEEMQELKRYINVTSINQHICVYSVAGSRIGKLVQFIFEEGANASGMEIALFQIECGRPKTAEFAGDYEGKFTEGRAYGITRLVPGTQVYNFGANRTEGEIIGIKKMTVKTHENCDAVLYNQIEVKNLQEGPFSVMGDSGSLVFIKEDDEYVCIGMVVGGTVEKRVDSTWEFSSVLIPIAPVLEKLGVTSFKSFMANDLAERLVSLERKLDSNSSQLNDKLNTILEKLAARETPP